MQLIALNEQGQRTHALEAQKKVRYACIECGNPVLLRGGLHKRLHFYHLDKGTCRLGGRSEIHLALQSLLASLFNNDNCILERRFPEIQRIADVCVENKKWIFEIQCSPITDEEVQARNSAYHSMGYTVFWILHEQTFLQDIPKSAESFLQFRPHFYTDMGENGEGVIYDQKIQMPGKRQVREGARAPIDLTQFKCHPKIYFTQPWVRARRFYWPGYFANDCLDQFYSRPILPMTFSLKELLRPFKLIYRLLLESSCR
jgi:competence protein CoiA